MSIYLLLFLVSDAASKGAVGALSRPISGCCGLLFTAQQLRLGSGLMWLLACIGKVIGLLFHAMYVERVGMRKFTRITHGLYHACRVSIMQGRGCAFEFGFLVEDSCAVKDGLRKTYEKCNDISQESRALIFTLLRESSEKDRKLHLSMYGKAAQLEKQMETKSAWFQEKYSGRTHGGIGCSSSQTDFPLTEKELHQLRMDKEALKEMLEEEAMNKKGQEEKIRQEQAESDAFFLEFGVVRYDSDCESSD
ncbi:hypothetical protein Tco_0626804 [Tanacetum coccineum]|uniref:Uncharacterized protein n=1 Tax=Tanacetum coccineum TaxID=301880 RepID=A0ABQ4WKQ0_9ASTR